MGVISWIALGAITGWVASKIGDKTGSSRTADIALGVIGAIVTGFLASLRASGDNVSHSIIAAIGAVAVLLVYDVIETFFPKVSTIFARFVSNPTGGALGQANPGGAGDALDARSATDAVDPQTAVGLLDRIAQMNADPKFDAAALRRDAAKRDNLERGPRRRTRRSSAIRALLAPWRALRKSSAKWSNEARASAPSVRGANQAFPPAVPPTG
jgi:uncharacterized membrane protein YeaQ/YmgE (transglycosylase-associated protein family)